MVQQILDTQKELEVDNAEAAAKRPGGVEIEKDAGFSDFNRQREREATQRDVQKLKDSIQVRIVIFFNCYSLFNPLRLLECFWLLNSQNLLSQRSIWDFIF